MSNRSTETAPLGGSAPLDCDVEVSVEHPRPLIAITAAKALAEELSQWAFEREKVLIKLDIRAARQARTVARSLVDAVSSFFVREVDREPPSEAWEPVSMLLAEAHALLSGEVERARHSTAPPTSGTNLIDEERRDDARVPSERVTARPPGPGALLSSPPVTVRERQKSDDEITPPGGMDAALIADSQALANFKDLFDEEEELTRPGLPKDVVEKYLHGLKPRKIG
jgi:hypothetical protein